MEQEFQHIGRKTLLLNARRLFQESGQSSLTLLAMKDITVRKQLEAALNQRVDELAAADRRKNEFLAMLAHELRNPLAPLRNRRPRAGRPQRGGRRGRGGAGRRCNARCSTWPG